MALRTPIARTAYTGSTLITAPASEPVSLEELKAQLGLDVASSAQDPRLWLIVTAAREMIERYTGRVARRNSSARRSRMSFFAEWWLVLAAAAVLVIVIYCTGQQDD